MLANVVSPTATVICLTEETVFPFILMAILTIRYSSVTAIVNVLFGYIRMPPSALRPIARLLFAPPFLFDVMVNNVESKLTVLALLPVASIFVVVPLYIIIAFVAVAVFSSTTLTSIALSVVIAKE